MKLLILSRAQSCYSTRRLREACVQRGHYVRVLDTLRFSMSVERAKPQILYRDKPITPYDAVIPRIGASITFYGTALVRQFEQTGVFTLASSHAISVSRDKLRALQVLSRHAIGIPPTVYVRDRQSVAAAIERLGGAPVVVKLIEGTQGVGVILADTKEVAQAIIETLQGARQNVLIQKFIRESRGRDIRAFVVGGRVVAAMRRVARGDEFRSNVHRGGRTEKVKLDPEYERTAIHAAQILGLRVAGVDMLESKDGPQVMEVNSSPGLEGIEKTTGIDIAGKIVEHIENEFLLPEVDIKQKLSIDKGYGVAEFQITGRSELRDKTLAELALAGRDVTVLSIQRGSVVLTSPRGGERLRLGDQLLCFGKLLTLKQLIPKDRRGRRRKSKSGAPDELPSVVPPEPDENETKTDLT
jgi:ribosomal protein S6--L-glutamate ligase